MSSRSSAPTRLVRASTAFFIPLFFWAGAVSAQNSNFDVDVARIGTGSRFSPFQVSESEPLADAIDAGKLQDDTRVLVMDHPAGRLAFLTDQMAFHHVAQGEIDGEPWMVSF